MTIELDYDEYWFIADMIIRRGNNAARKIRDTELFLEENKNSLTEKSRLYHEHVLADAKATRKITESLRLKLMEANK